MSPTLSDMEAQDLELHVKVCAQRYGELETRLTNLENKVENLALKIDDLRVELAKTFLTASGTVIVAIVSGIAVVLTKF